MSPQHNLYKIQFLMLIALIIILTGLFANDEKLTEWRPLLVTAALALIIVVAFRYADLFMRSEKKPEAKDVFDYTTKDTSPKVLGRLAELKYGERRKRDKFEEYYAVKK